MFARQTVGRVIRKVYGTNAIENLDASITTDLVLRSAFYAVFVLLSEPQSLICNYPL
jgi:hypothetical protein